MVALQAPAIRFAHAGAATRMHQRASDLANIIFPQAARASVCGREHAYTRGHVARVCTQHKFQFTNAQEETQQGCNHDEPR